MATLHFTKEGHWTATTFPGKEQHLGAPRARLRRGASNPVRLALRPPLGRQV